MFSTINMSENKKTGLWLLPNDRFNAGADPGWGAPGAPPPPPPPPKIGKNMIFWRKIVIFHTKYPKNFRASLRSAHFFLSAPP